MPATGPVGDVQVNVLDGGVSRRLVRRCRTAASVLLAVAGSLLLVVALAPWGVTSALATLVAGVLLVGSVLLLSRGGLWSAAARSAVQPAEAGTPAEPGTTATIGPTRPMSPGLAGAPIKRRLKSYVVPIYAPDGPPPGGGALVIHARADGAALTEGDSVHLWRVNTGGLTSLGEASVGGRFVLYRATDNAVFLGTTRITDTW